MIPFSLDLHADRPWVFSKQFIEMYSEADYQYKFWSYIFESFLGTRCFIAMVNILF